GYVQTVGLDGVRVRIEGQAEKQITAEALQSPFNEPLSYLAAVVKGKIKPSGQSCLGVNMIVSEILEAARQSAGSGKTILLQPENAIK
ncbi:MAG: gfo/Idh/MocA family oxidoreductase, partial [Planctomycetota bacterium]|nr:gfo/Idh/MocA family oxidoreductase [Planctomycetota bacterium]